MGIIILKMVFKIEFLKTLLWLIIICNTLRIEVLYTKFA